MANEMVKKLLEAGVHFGHQSKRWNPKMQRFIFGERGGIYIIDLEKTQECLNQARDIVREIAAKGGLFLFVGTKKQAQDVIEAEAQRVGMFYVKSRWMGGLLTNFETVKKSVRKLKDIEKKSNDGVFNRLTKKEVALLTKELDRLKRDIGGITEMVKLPAAMIVVDTKKEELAVKEANRLGIPVIGIVDTNCDPDLIDYPVPGNDDAVKSVKYLVGLLTDSIAEGRKEFASSEEIRKSVQQKEPEVAAAPNAASPEKV